MRLYQTTLPALAFATPGLAHHQDVGTMPVNLLHSPLGLAGLGLVLLAAALAARRHLARRDPELP